jgi:crossover junction endodeoxyribonuclease RusA
VAALEFVVFGTPVAAQGSSDAKRFWQARVRAAAAGAVKELSPSSTDLLVLRVAYFYVYAPAGDLDNIVKPIQDALKGVAYVDDVQVVDLIASMRSKGVDDWVPFTSELMSGFSGGSDFVHISVDRSSRIEAFNDYGRAETSKDRGIR